MDWHAHNSTIFQGDTASENKDVYQEGQVQAVMQEELINIEELQEDVEMRAKSNASDKTGMIN